MAANKTALRRIEASLDRLPAEFLRDGGLLLSPLQYTARGDHGRSTTPLIVTTWYHMTADGIIMRYAAPLNGLFFSSTSTRVLRVLMREGARPRTGRDLARLAKAPPHRTSQVLAKFEREGLVQSQVVGPAYLWSLHEQHPLVPALRSLFASEAEEARRRKALLRRTLGSVPGVRRALLFGSAARGEERAGSDLDILVVASNKRALKRIEDKLGALRVDTWEKGGMRISPLLYTARQFEQKRHLAVIQAAEREGEELLA